MSAEDAVADQWLSQETFSNACAALPLVSIDLMITRPGPRGLELLLGLRNNRPAQGWWFTPGGRIRKNEAFAAAIRRVARDELGLHVGLAQQASLLGVWDHLYPDSAFDPAVSTHYVNLPHALHLSTSEAHKLNLPAGARHQHQGWRWQSLEEAATDPEVHEYVRVVAGLL